MRVGRLRSSTLANILKSIDNQDDGTNVDPFPASTKQYIPCASDSPLYRLVTIMHPQTDSETGGNQRSNSEIDDARLRFIESRTISDAGPTYWGIRPEPPTPRASSLPNLLPVHVPRPTAPLPSILPIPLNHPTVNTSMVSGELPEDQEDLESIEAAAVTNTMISNVSSHSLGARHESNSEMGDTRIAADIARTNTIPNLEIAVPDATKPQPTSWANEYSHIDIEWTMQAMDVLYNASFYDYIREEKNVDLSSIRLARVIKDYKPRQVAIALRWMVQGWSIESTAKLLRTVFSDWLPDLAGCVFALISKDWPHKPQISLCCAYLLIAEPPAVSALFLRSVTGSWEKEKITDLIGYLDSILEWDEAYFRDLMTIYSDLIRSDVKRATSAQKTLPTEHDHDKMLSYLATLYRNSLTMTSYKMALADARLALAEYNLLICQHLTTCSKCQENVRCDVLASIKPPQIPAFPNLTDGVSPPDEEGWEDVVNPLEQSQGEASTTEAAGLYDDLGSKVELSNAVQLVSLLNMGVNTPIVIDDPSPFGLQHAEFANATLPRQDSKESLRPRLASDPSTK